MDTQEKHTFWLRKRIILAAVAGSLVLTAVTAVVFRLLIPQSQQQPEPAANQAEVEQAERNAKQAEADGKLQAEAAKQITGNNTGEAEKIYQQAVDAASGLERKTQLYIDLSAVYYKEKRIDLAIAAAKRAEQQNPDKFLVADWLSRIYEDQKNYKEAEKYYRLAAEWAKSPQNKTALGKSYYEDEANRVAKLGAAK